MRRRNGLRALLAAAAALLPLSLSPTSAAAPATGGSAIRQLGACLGAQKSGDLLLLIDQSGSLKQTDPSGVRVQAASYLLTQLSEYAQQAGIALDVAVSGFDKSYSRVVPWQRLSAQSLPGVTRGVDAFAGRNSGVDTDYVNAFSGGRDELRSRQRGSATQRCQAMIWISDGQYDIEPRLSSQSRKAHGTTKPYAPGVSLTSAAGADAAEKAGQQALCRQGGIADQLRVNGALTFGVGLGASASTFGLMSAIATGKGQGCGTSPTTTVGDFRLATDVDGLIFALDALTVPGTSSIDRTTGVCPRVACSAEAHSFVLDASIRSVHVLAGADKPGIDVVLTPPGTGRAQRFHYVGSDAAQNVTLAGQRLRAHWLTEKTLQLDLAHKADAGWVGQWSVTFVDVTNTHQGARARTQLRITGDLIPALAVPDVPLRSGDTATLRLGLASEATGKPVAAEAIRGRAVLSAALVDGDGKVVEIVRDATPVALARGSQVALSGFAPGAAVLRMSLSVRTAGLPAAGSRPAIPGTQLADRQVDVPLTVLPPLDFPSVGARVDFGRHEGIGPFTSSIGVNGPGCVWVGDSSVTAGPDAIGAVKVTSKYSSPESCLAVPDGTTTQMPLALSVEKPGNGTVAGKVVVDLAPEGKPERAVEAKVAYVGDVHKPVNKTVKRAAFWLALLLGVGLPVLFLYAIKWWAARIPGEGLAVRAFEVDVTGNQVLRGGQPFTFAPTEMRLVGVPAGGVRRVSLTPEGVDLATKTGLSPSGESYTRALAPGFVVLGEKSGGRLPLAVHNQWFALVPPAGGGQVRVVALMSSAGATAESYERVARSVRDRLPQIVTRARADGTVTAPPAPAASAWGNAPGEAGGWGGDSPSGAPSTASSTWGSTGAAPPPPSTQPGASPGWGAPPPPGSTPPAPGGWGSPPIS